jgi:hypothetical protein
MSGEFLQLSGNVVKTLRRCDVKSRVATTGAIAHMLNLEDCRHMRCMRKQGRSRGLVAQRCKVRPDIPEPIDVLPLRTLKDGVLNERINRFSQ